MQTDRQVVQQSARQTVGESDVQEKRGSITSVLQPGPQSAALSPEMQLHGWILNSCISTVGPAPPSVPQTCWPARKHAFRHTGLKLICIYCIWTHTLSRAKQKSLLKALFHLCRCGCFNSVSKRFYMSGRLGDISYFLAHIL